MKAVNLQAAKTDLSRLVDQAVAGEDIVIAGPAARQLLRRVVRRRARRLGGTLTRLLVDAHVRFWWLLGDERLSPARRADAAIDSFGVERRSA